jgi:hypothetical protein
MASDDAKDDVFAMVLVDLAGICKKLADSSALPDELRTRARKFADEFDTLAAHYGSGTPQQHAEGEGLLFKITRFLPDVLEHTGSAARVTALGNVA